MKNMTILQLVYKLNAISIERNNISMKLIHDPDSKTLQAAMEVLNEEHDAVIYELCGRLPHLEGDENLIPINKKKGR